MFPNVLHVRQMDYEAIALTAQLSLLFGIDLTWRYLK
jgi:hypothetical protein